MLPGLHWREQEIGASRFESMARVIPGIREAATMIGSAITRRGRIYAIQRLVAQHCGIPIAAMTSPCRLREMARPRQVGMYLARELTPHSLPEIGRAFGKHYTTVMHGCERVAELMAIDPDFAAEVASLRAQAQQAG